MNLPFLPYRGFITLIGEEMAPEADRQLARPGVLGLVLLSDAPGHRLALLAIGVGETYTRFEEVEDLDVDGVRACCGLRVADIVAAQNQPGADQEFAQREAALATRERQVAETEERLNEIVRTLAERDIVVPPVERV